jgi:hypothetical protein
MPIRINFSHSSFETGALEDLLNNKNGANTRDPIKYRNPAIVRGPRLSKPIFTITNVDDQIIVTRRASVRANLRRFIRDFPDQNSGARCLCILEVLVALRE